MSSKKRKKSKHHSKKWYAKRARNKENAKYDKLFPYRIKVTMKPIASKPETIQVGGFWRALAWIIL